MKKVKQVVILSLVLAVAGVQANNIRVENMVLRDQDTATTQVTVQFDLSWENSWRNELNHDAAWVFIKFKAPMSNHWQHAYLVTEAESHRVLGGVVEIGTSLIDNTACGMGAFLYSAGMQTGTVQYARTRLRWDYGASGYAFAKGEEIDVAVNAIEMVYVAEGSFFVGSGGTERDSFTDGAWVQGGTFPYMIESEAAITMAKESGCLWDLTGSMTAGTVLPSDYPKGFAAFYCMKYEVTQGQYSDFLNLLTTAQANTRFPNNYGNYRHTIRKSEAGRYVCEAPDRACNYLSWMDGAAYFAWAGLRPMTEFEYEKACRGFATPVPMERAWGNTSSRAQRNHYIDGPEDGSGEELSTSDVGGVTLGGNFNNSNTLKGPVRVGIYAATAEAAGLEINRDNTGASYWGIMELTGNLYTRTVSVLGSGFTGSHGTGALSTAGHATSSDWPGYSGSAVSGATGSGYRGGIWSDTSDMAHISNRWYAKTVQTSRSYLSGARAVRTAPAP